MLFTTLGLFDASYFSIAPLTANIIFFVMFCFVAVPQNLKIYSFLFPES